MFGEEKIQNVSWEDQWKTKREEKKSSDQNQWIKNKETE